MFLALAGAVSVAAGTFTPDDTTTSETVTRGTAGLIALPSPIPRLPSEPVSQQLRSPVRVAGAPAAAHDLGNLVNSTLEHLGHSAAPDDALHLLLVQTLAEGQSDAYIDAVLNSALRRGEYAPPAELLTKSGMLDTDRLLAAVLDQVER